MEVCRIQSEKDSMEVEWKSYAIGSVEVREWMVGCFEWEIRGETGVG